VNLFAVLAQSASAARIVLPKASKGSLLARGSYCAVSRAILQLLLRNINFDYLSVVFSARRYQGRMEYLAVAVIFSVTIL
jgi:hypothetical protein